jgi:putative membrane protein
VKGFLTRLIITALGLWAASAIVSGFQVDGAGNLVVAALLLGIANAVVRPIVISLAFVAWLMPGVGVSGLLSATLAALVVSVVSWFASTFVGSSGRIERYRRVEVRARTLD